MNVLQKFIDETFEIMTGLGEMKVAEAIFLSSVDNASQTIANSSHRNDGKLLREVLSQAYKGQNIIKMCAHLPKESNAEKNAYELSLIAHKIDSLTCCLPPVSNN
ncbi:unnamed protein product [Caenorhabditis sp. 36 PRJEB53466]|nr:unnamed protein product [Caenorhabditis sp. 36 PRJEB53466]